MARREEAWDRLEKAYADDARVDGAIFGRVKGGFTVDLVEQSPSCLVLRLMCVRFVTRVHLWV